MISFNDIVTDLVKKDFSKTNAINNIHRCIYFTSKQQKINKDKIIELLFNYPTFKNINFDNIKVECLNGTRKFIVIPVPFYIKEWIVSAQIFYLSTDTSNIYGFKDIFFPTYGILERGGFGKPPGWITKSVKEKKTWYDKICNVFLKKEEEKSREDSPIFPSEKENCMGYKNFLGKFDEWWQVSISAKLGGSFWERDDMKYIRDLALHYRWDDKVQNFKEIENKIKYLLYLSSSIKEFSEVPSNIRFTNCETLSEKNNIDQNKWFKKHNALVIKSIQDYQKFFKN